MRAHHLRGCSRNCYKDEVNLRSHSLLRPEKVSAKERLGLQKVCRSGSKKVDRLLNQDPESTLYAGPCTTVRDPIT